MSTSEAFIVLLPSARMKNWRISALDLRAHDTLAVQGRERVAVHGISFINKKSRIKRKHTWGPDDAFCKKERLKFLSTFGR